MKLVSESMSFKRENDSYEQLFILFSHRVEQWFIKIIAGLLVLLLIIQWLLQFPAIRIWFSEVEQMEGTSYKFVDFRNLDVISVPQKGK